MEQIDWVIVMAYLVLTSAVGSVFVSAKAGWFGRFFLSQIGKFLGGWQGLAWPQRRYR